MLELRSKKVKENDYLQLAKNTDEAVRESEPGMVHHTFDADPENPLCFVWSELYQNDAEFFAHLNNAPLASKIYKWEMDCLGLCDY